MNFAVIVVLALIAAVGAVSVLPCGPNDLYLECGSACPETCDTLGEVKPCTRQCIRGCFCQLGYVRNTVTGECVKPCDCPPKTTTTTPVPTGAPCS
ncbi:AAEL000302-PA [Aedes aegypti]|uniref:AAEL000302-PA n=1 Tax=Aedes aegypti TaxID=7159 RepID=Q17PL1_AEDAE|nr:AAEL000302-PA [Aedes aegypti]